MLPHPLIPRELYILKKLGRGWSNVEKYIAALLLKIQVTTREEAALYAIREGFTDD